MTSTLFIESGELMNKIFLAFDNLPMKKRLIIIFLSLSVFASFITGVVSVSISTSYTKSYKVRWLRHLTQTIGNNNYPYLNKKQSSKVETNLDDLRLLPEIKFCSIYCNENSLSAHFNLLETNPFDDITENPETSYSEIIGKYIIINEPIHKDGLYVGNIKMIAESKLGVLVFKISSILFIFIVIFAGLSLFLSLKIQKLISKPIGELINASEEISNTGNYSIRIKSNFKDDIGKFVNHFNNMLNAIQTRDFELLKSSEKFTNIFNAQSDSIIILDNTGDILDVNHATLRMLSISRIQALNLNLFRDLELKSDTESDISKLIAHTINDGFAEFDGECIKPLTKSAIKLQVNIRKLDISEPPLLIMSAKDVTIQKRDEAELASLRDYLSNVINSMPSLLIGLDSEKRITQWNEKASQETGVQHKVAIGQRFQDLFPHLESEIDKVDKAIDLQEVQRVTRKAHNDKGHQKIEDITIYPLSGEVAKGAVVIINDITERINMEKMMIQSEKMMSIGGLAAGMAHEINNPLAGIIQNVQIVQNRLTKVTSKNNAVAEEIGVSLEMINAYVQQRGIEKMLSYIQESGVRASVIVRNMLSFSRKGNHEKVKSSIVELVDNTIQLAFNEYDLKKKLDFRKINIVKHYEEKIPMIMCDPGSIQQVFLNIFKNGAQAMQKIQDENYTPEFNISISAVNNSVRIVIRDNGPGIPDEILGSIFEPFFTTKEVGEGTGLGMSVSYFIITDKHGGTITVDSQLGKWTSFAIELPTIIENDKA